jgi:putative ubiquitin-RnfH superfamily antitoxin RatB of RatAB toxin-antitoxin module
MAPVERGSVEVVYALPGRQRVVEIEFTDGLTAREAVTRSGLPVEFVELTRDDLDLGVFGRVVRPGHRLAPGDRVEIYRRLRNDPKDARRRLAASGTSKAPRR